MLLAAASPIPAAMAVLEPAKQAAAAVRATTATAWHATIMPRNTFVNYV
jgi:hypothetical protein